MVMVLEGGKFFRPILDKKKARKLAFFVWCSFGMKFVLAN